MNCKNCGAPMQMTDASGHFYCVYCETRQIHDAPQVSIDGISCLGTLAEKFCPGCPDEIELTHGKLDDRPIWYCPSCFGFFIECGNFSYVLQIRRAEYQGAETPAMPINQDELRQRFDCPHCEKLMDTHPYSGPGNQVIKSCFRCASVWLEHGKLTNMVKAPGTRECRPIEVKVINGESGDVAFNSGVAKVKAKYNNNAFNMMLKLFE